MPKSMPHAVQAATSRAQTSALIRAAAPRIEEALGKDGPSWLDFRRALIESNLLGRRDRWNRMALEAEQSHNNDLPEISSRHARLRALQGSLVAASH